MSEMKMSDVFALPVYRGVQEVNIHNKEKPCIVSGTSTTVIARPKYIEATIHAINNHDRMAEELKSKTDILALVVEEKSRMAEEIAELKDLVTLISLNSSFQTNMPHEADMVDKLLAKLNQEGEE